MSKFLHDINLAQPLSDHPIWRDVRGVWLPVPQLSGGSTLYDLSPYGNHGTLNGMDPATDWIATEHGLALDFDGSDHILLPSAAIPVIGYDDFTFVAEVNSLSVTSYGGIITKGITNAGEVMFYRSSSYLIVYADAGVIYSSKSIFTVGVDYHVAAVREGNLLTMYVDGKSVATDISATANITTTKSPVIGAADEGASRRWIGTIASAFVSDRALSPDEIATLYDQSLRGYPDLINRVPTLRHFFMGQVAATTGGPFPHYIRRNLAGGMSAGMTGV